MKKEVLTNARLVSYEIRNSSAYVDPSWFLCFTTELVTIKGKAADDAPCGNTVTNFSDGRPCDVAYHITRAGNVIIDGIKEVVESDNYDPDDEFAIYRFK